MHSKGVHIPQPIHSKLYRLCPESVQPDSPAGALAGRADQPRSRSPVPSGHCGAPAGDEVDRQRICRMGPASFAQAPSGATCRTISAVRRRRARNRGPRGRQRGRRAREPPGNRSQAQNSFCGENGFSGGGATSGGPTTKPERTTKQAGRTQHSPRRQRSRGRRGRTAGGNTRVGWAHTSNITGEARRRLPGAISCRACPGTGRRAGRHRAGADGRDCYTSQQAMRMPPKPRAVLPHFTTSSGRDVASPPHCLINATNQGGPAGWRRPKGERQNRARPEDAAAYQNPLSRIRQTQAALSGASSCSAFSV